jgi:hypothetical protein
VILVKEHVIELAHIDHFAALLAAVEVFFLRIVKLIEVRDDHFLGFASLSSDFCPDIRCSIIRRAMSASSIG